MNRRAVITGVGVLTPIGTSKETFWDALIHGRSGIGRITCFDTSCYTSSLGGEIRDFKPEDHLTSQEVETLDRSCHLLLVAAAQALAEAFPEPNGFDAGKAAVLVGSTTAADASNFHGKWGFNGLESVSDRDIFRHTSETLPNCVSGKYGLKGASILVTNACAAGTYAIGQGMDLIRSGRADMVIAGGTECLNDLAMCGFNCTRTLTPERIRPFAGNRKGLLLGEGAAVLILEELDTAVSRKAEIYGEVAGYGLSCDARHMTAPDPDGKHAALSIRAALADADIPIDAVDYISAHGTGTPLNDRMETRAVKEVFGPLSYNIPISSIKSMIGHTLGASGAIEAAACAMILKHGVIPPTINHDRIDPECDLDYVPEKAIKREIRTILSNSYAFGGNNASIILRTHP